MSSEYELCLMVVHCITIQFLSQNVTREKSAGIRIGVLGTSYLNYGKNQQ